MGDSIFADGSRAIAEYNCYRVVDREVTDGYKVGEYPHGEV